MRTILVLGSMGQKRAFYNLPNARLSTAAVFEFIGRRGGVSSGPVRARRCTRRRAWRFV